MTARLFVMLIFFKSCYSRFWENTQAPVIFEVRLFFSELFDLLQNDAFLPCLFIHSSRLTCVVVFSLSIQQRRVHGSFQGSAGRSYDDRSCLGGDYDSETQRCHGQEGGMRATDRFEYTARQQQLPELQ